MNSTRWQMTQEMFHRVVDLPDSEKHSFLERECAGDAECFAEVMEMLRGDRVASGLLDGRIKSHETAGLSSIASRLVGNLVDTVPVISESGFVVGPYTLDRLLGEGGMGVVWLASRKDTDTPVAIKFLPHAGLSPARRDLFAGEIRMLAKLRHPYIGRMYDAGSLADGTPWFVMEYVEGQRLTDYCDAHSLSLPKRLLLFHQICEAVLFAHSQGVIHRDLKPSNILVEKNGSPRLLDFGIARELQGLEEPGQQTRPGLRFMSPDYAAPEWIQDGTVGLYTDVYALGVTMYQLLTDRLPFERVRTQDRTEKGMFQVPPKPSMVAAGRYPLRKFAWSELDTICIKAMQSDRKERYLSVEALLRDLDHYTNQEPLDARPQGTLYRAKKFIVRNRVRVLVSVLALSFIVGLIAFYTVRLARARNTAVAEATRAKHIQALLIDMFNGSERSAGPAKDLRVVTLLERGAKKAEELNDDPQTQAELYQTLGRMYDMLGEPQVSAGLIDHAIESEKRAGQVNKEEMVDLLVIRGIVLADSSRFKEGEASVREGLELARNNFKSDSSEVIYAKSGLGKVLGASGDYAGAIDVLEPLTSVTPKTKDDEDAFSQTLSSLGVAQYALGHYDAAEATSRRALAFDEKIYGDKYPRVAGDLLNIALDEGARSHYAEAELNTRQASRIMDDWYGPDHPDAALASSQLGRVLMLEGKDEEAYPLVLKALAAEEKAYGEKDETIAVSLDSLGRLELKRSDYVAAEKDFRRGMNIFEALYGVDNYKTAVLGADLGDVIARSGKPATAEELLGKEVGVLERTLPANDLHISHARATWGHVLLAEHRYEKAERELLAAELAMENQPIRPEAELKQVQDDLANARAPRLKSRH